MRYLKCILVLLLCLCCLNVVLGQTEVTGKYKGHIVKMKYYRGSPDDIQYLEYGLVTDLNKQIKKLEGDIAKMEKELKKLKGKSSASNDDDLERQLLIKERDLLACERSVDSLKRRVVAVRDSLVARENMLNDSVRALHAQLDEARKTGFRTFSPGGPYFGVGYSIGMPLIFSSLLNQKMDSGESVWKRRVTFSHQVGIYWGSRSLVKKGSLSLGIGLEYSRLKFAAGIGQLSDTVRQATDSDQCNYTAFLSYRNVEESATLHYISIPLTLSFGQPYRDRISGYAQITLTPSFCIGSSLSASGNYSHKGYYSDLYGNSVNLTLDNFSALGFGPNRQVSDCGKTAEINRFLLTGRLAGGIYLPMCRVQQGKTSPWVFKLGVKMDFAITPVAKGMSDDTMLPEATYRLNQFNLMSGDGCRFVSFGLEAGIMYVFGNKN